MFEGWSIAVESEAPERAEYSLRRKTPARRATVPPEADGAAVRLIFAEKAEERVMPVALASMFAKYVREVLMLRFNAYWLARAPEVKATAGYWTDGQRFVKEIAEAAKKEGVVLRELIRSR
jgi:ribonuclease HII